MARRRIFDLRVLIGAVFVIYGIALGVAGLFDDAESLAKAGGLPVNLWTGLGMLALGVFFLLWARFGRSGGRAEETSPD